jgi:ABC-type lipoprotein release transport system permease subunit
MKESCSPCYAFAPLEEHLNEASQENRLRTMPPTLLGAMRNQIVARFLFQGSHAALIGCAGGLALGMGPSHFIGSMLSCPWSVVCPALLIAACASLVPTLRASRVEPVLREE